MPVTADQSAFRKLPGRKAAAIGETIWQTASGLEGLSLQKALATIVGAV